MRSKIYKKVILPVISGLLAITTGCSNIPVVNSAVNTSYVSTAQSSIQNNFSSASKSLLHKKFSTLSATDGTESIAISKRYVFSSSNNYNFQSTDNDSQGQAPNRVKIIADIKKTNATGGINFVIDGVTTFTAPGTAGPFAGGMGTVIDYNTNFFRYEFIWDGKYTDGRLVEDGVYSVHALKNTSGTKALGLDIELNVTSDPLVAAGMEFFEPKDFSDLVTKIEGISNVPEDTANSLYDKAQEIKTLNEKLLNLQSRVPQDTAKISQIQQQISSANSARISLANSLASQLNQLDNQKNVIRTHLNTITNNSSLSVDYPISDKPDNINNYIIVANSLHGDFSVSLLSSQVPLYQKDSSDIGADDFKQSWEVSDNRTEKIDAKSLFKGTNSYLNEIQTAKNLINDYISGNLISNELKNEEAIHDLIAQMNYHHTILKSKSKVFSNNYQKIYLEIRKAAINLHNSILLPLAITMSKLPEFHNNAFVLQALKFNAQGLNNGDSSVLQSWMDNFAGVLGDYLSSNLATKEKAVAIWMGKSLSEFESIKANDALYGTNVAQSLVDETTAIINAHYQAVAAYLFLPQTEEEMAVFVVMLEADMATGFTATIPGIGVYLATKWGLNSIASKLLTGKLIASEIPAGAKQALEFSKNIRGTSAEGTKFTERLVPKRFNSTPCFKSGYSILGLDDCLETLGKQLLNIKSVKYLKRLIGEGLTKKSSLEVLTKGKNPPLTNEAFKKLEYIAKNYDEATFIDLMKGQVDFQLLRYKGLEDYVINGQKKLIGLDTPVNSWQTQIYDETIKIYREFLRNDGVNISTYGLKNSDNTFIDNLDIYMIDFESLVTSNGNGKSIFTVEIQGMDGKWSKIGVGDFRKASEELVKSFPSVSRIDFDNYIEKEFTWHHQNLVEMLMIPSKLHTGKVQHPGAREIINRVSTVNDNTIYNDGLIREILNDSSATLRNLFNTRFSKK